MCFGGMPKAQPLPPTPPAAARMSDPSVQNARNDAINSARGDSGLASTQLNSNLGGQGTGKRNLAGSM